MKSSRRDLSNNMAEQRPILKNNENTHYPRFNFTPQTGTAFPKTDILLYDKVRWLSLSTEYVGFQS